MRILLLVHAFNSLSQRIFVELEDDGHDVSVEFDINDAVLVEAVDLFKPDIIVAPFLKRAIGKNIWSRLPCLIVHPGIEGDRGPSALDWAVLNNEREWGVTVLQAEAEMDAGPVWASTNFPMRNDATKSSLYRNEVTEAAVAALRLALDRYKSGKFAPQRPNETTGRDIRGQSRPPARQADRKIDWQSDTTEVVLRKIRSADGMPGVKDELFGTSVLLCDVRPAPGLSGAPGELIARSGPAVCRATADGAVWIGHVTRLDAHQRLKLPATMTLTDQIGSLPEIPRDTDSGYSEIRYEEKDGVGYLHFDFYNGAMSSSQCERLLAAYREALTRPTNVIVLMGGPDFWSNGMNLNVIEASSSAADESWRNINAIDDLAEAIITTTSHLTVSAMQGNAGAGGVFLARSADYVWLRKGIILSPHYKDMGNLFGSEFWTYLLPRYAGQENADEIAESRLPMGTRQAVSLGLADNRFSDTYAEFSAEVEKRARDLSGNPDFTALLSKKLERREADEKVRPLNLYRSDELKKMKQNFYGFDPSYHIARYNFVHKIPKSRTPVTIARHRDLRLSDKRRRAS